MKPSATINSRREFMKNCSLSAALICFSTEWSLGNNTSNILTVSAFRQDESNNSLLNILCNHSKISLTKSKLLSDMIYIDCISQNTIQNIYNAISHQKHLLLNSKICLKQIQNDILPKCKEAGVMVAIIEEDAVANKQFTHTVLYQNKISSGIDIQKCINFIDILNRSTQHNRFFIAD
jgi:hypothetical protein